MRWGSVSMRMGLGLGLLAPTGCPGDDGDPIPSNGSSGSTGATPSSSSGTPDGSTSGISATSGVDTSSGTMGPGATGPDTDGPLFDVGGISDMGGGNGCSSDLKQVIDANTGTVVQTCPPDQGCLEGQCVPACLAASGADGSMGCEFWVPTSPFYANGNPAASQSGPCHALLVSNPWDRPAMLDLSYDGMPYDVTMVSRIPSGIAGATVYDPLPVTGVPSGQVAVVFLAHRPGVANGSTLECPVSPAVLQDTATHGTAQGVAFELSSDTPIQVYDIIPYGGAATYLPSASLIYPSTAWGDSYLALTPHTPDGTEWILAVARDDATTVSFQPSVAVAPGSIANAPTGMLTDYVIDAGEVLQWHGSGDLAASILLADKPIGVFAGNTYLRVTTADGPISGRDSSHQMIPDANALASTYVGPGLFSRLAGFMPESVLYRLQGVVDGTALTWDPMIPGVPASIDAGDVIEFETRDFFSVSSQDEDHPFSLSQYMSGTLSGQPGCTGGGGFCQLGDDEWVMLVPPDQFLESYAFFVDPTYGTSTLVFVRESSPLGWHDVELDCMGVVGGWQPVGTGGQFEVAHVELFRSGVATIPACATSQHFAHSDGNFGVLVWGTDSASSYGYPAGGNLQALNGIEVGPAG